MICIHTVNRKDTTKEFKNTLNQRFGGWKMYFKLFKQSMAMLKKAETMAAIMSKNSWYRIKNTHIKVMLLKTVIFFMKVAFFFQCIYKPLKQFYSYTTISKGEYLASFRNDELVSYWRLKQCTKRTKHYLFGILFLITGGEMSDKELEEIINNK
jgi:hypothetical protein